MVFVKDICYFCISESTLNLWYTLCKMASEFRNSGSSTARHGTQTLQRSWFYLAVEQYQISFIHFKTYLDVTIFLVSFQKNVHVGSL